MRTANERAAHLHLNLPKRFDCYPHHDHLMAIGECVYPLFEDRRDWRGPGFASRQILVVEEMRFDQLQQMADSAAGTVRCNGHFRSTVPRSWEGRNTAGMRL